MTDASGIKVDGLKDLNRALKEIGYPQKEISAAAKLAGEATVAEARNLVPVRSGKLRDTIRLAATARGVTIRAGNNTTVQYANPIHWGWFKRHIKPNPFFAKALGYTRQEIYDNYYKQMDDLIKRNGSQVK
jgi:HK97 gp10 family phage protein